METTRRPDLLDRLRDRAPWDVVVIGGGATGLGSAVDAASRGYRTLLLEAHDFAKGTSSRSTKLVHGGVRYLARGEIGLVREALRERGILLRNAPHLVHDRAFLVPSYRWWTKPYYGLGLGAYDLLAGRLGIGRTRLLGRSEALARVPTLEPEHLRGGVLYRDGQFDDARLVVALVRTLLDLGGTALNYAEVVGLDHRDGRVHGVRARDAETSEEFAVAARAVVNATGVYADAVRRLDQADAPTLIRPSQGAHVVLDRAFLPGETALMVPKTDDGRVLFAIPWQGRTLVGTTDTPVDATPIEPRPLAAEVDYIMEYARRYLTRDPDRTDIRSAFAGLRPLIAHGAGGTTAALSREHSVFVSDSGLVTITGGKWTTYRRMGIDAIDQAAAVGGLEPRPSRTESQPIHGRPEDGAVGRFAEYGSDAAGLLRLIVEQPTLGEPLHPALEITGAEVVWAARFELARTVEDVLARRSRSLFLDARASTDVAPQVAAILAGELGHDEGWRREQVHAFEAIARGYLV